MSYLVLARKWRPKTFDDIIGQEYITQTLKNSVSSGKIAHALIFSGPRGVGKTSSARIVAKALNCINGPTPEPCSECTFCREIADGKSLDVIEIDAASHTGVNDIREIIENVKYLPASGRTKIYIIDEAHMLSQSAFNALLKTLEEPPPHVLFILATTESHKIPVTILSRCQRYDYKKVSVEKIKERLETVASKEGIKVPEETLYLLAQEADGGLRDALSLLDQLIATFGTEIDREEATKILGLLDKSLIKSTLQAIFNKDAKDCIEILNTVSEKGISPKRFSEDLLKALRNALILKAGSGDILSELSKDEKKDLEKISANQNIESLEVIFSLMLEGSEHVQKSFYPRMALEATLVKLCLVQTTVPLDEILGKIETLQKKIGGGAATVRRDSVEPPSSKVESTRKEPSQLAEPKNNSYRLESVKPETPPTEAEQEEKTDSQPKGTSVQDFVAFVKSKSQFMGSRLEKVEEIKVEDSLLIAECSAQSVQLDYLMKNQDSLRSLAKEFFGKDLKVKVVAKSNSKNEGSSVKEQNMKKKEDLQKDPVVQNTLEIFGGRVVKITNKEKE